MLAHREQRDGFCHIARSVVLEVWPSGAEDDIEHSTVGSCYTEACTCPDDSGSDVEAVAREVWNPSRFESDEVFYEVEKGIGVRCLFG